MARTQRKQTRADRIRANQKASESFEVFEQPVVTVKRAPPLEPQNEKQKRYMNAIKSFQVVFGIGPAGTGKTYVAGAIACEMLKAKQIEKIIITRPAVDAGESLGFLPGELEDKYEPYITPLRSVFEARLGKSEFEYFLRVGKIQALPLAYMRGMTFDDAFVILDESQNVTPSQMKMFLTRIGKNCKVVIDGDIEQKDIQGVSGLSDAISKISYIPSIKVVKFDDEDVVRSGLVAEIIKAYRQKENDS